MYIVRASIENIRGFGEHPLGVKSLDFRRSDGRCAGWTVIAGRNGSGKSTLLRCLALAVAGPAAARTLQESFAGWIRRGSSKGVSLVVIEYGEEDRFTSGGRLPKNEFAVGMQWAAADGSEPAIHSAAVPMKTAMRGPWADNPEGWFVAGYGPFRRLSGHASDAQRLMVGPKRVARVVSLFREDASLVESVQWLKANAFRKLETKPGAAELEAVVIRLLGDGLLPDGLTVERIDSEALWVRHGDVVLPLSDLSDGYRTMAALVLDIVKQLFECYGEIVVTDQEGLCVCSHPGVILIDEIDVHLHVSWQKKVGFWLKKHFPNIQFIVTTHSPFICQAADDRGLIRLPGPSEQRPAEHVSEEVFRAVVNGGADDAIVSELFGLDSTYSESSVAVRETVAALEAKIARGTATPEEMAQWKQMSLELPNSQADQVERVLGRLEKQK